jgi:cAMP-binding proteins - catabolite gene activator and regulatory subunit of cAMP-dependent protein kinases
VPSAGPSDLASVPLFGSLSEPERAEIAAWFEVKEVGPGVRLVGEGATGNAFFVIGEGEVAVSAGGTEFATLGPGDFFGELALLRAGRRTATVTTTAPSRILVLFRNDFARLQAAHPRVAADLEAALQQRL